MSSSSLSSLCVQQYGSVVGCLVFLFVCGGCFVIKTSAVTSKTVRSSDAHHCSDCTFSKKPLIYQYEV